MKHSFSNPRPLAPGMGEAVARRTILRKKNFDGSAYTKEQQLADEPHTWETWGDVASRVSLGNALISETNLSERWALQDHIANGSILMSGRHLQHGDSDQLKRPQEVFTNCSTAATSFMKFYLLLNGSGVGRSYDDDMMVVDWSKMPYIHCVLAREHKDFDHRVHETPEQAIHKYGGHGITSFRVGDTREGWAQALEFLERMTFEATHEDEIIVFDFSFVRPAGSLIRGMQNRPSSGPVPTMNAFNAISSLKGCKRPRWWQNMYVDHYTAESVLVGGSRRSSRIAVKHWRDPGILEFINIKKPLVPGDKYSIPLWSANNSVGADEEFWAECNRIGTWANIVLEAAMSVAYQGGTGDPGIVNLHKLERNDEGFSEYCHEEYANSEHYPILHGKMLLKKVAEIMCTKRYPMIVNPCVPDYTRFLTINGLKQLKDISVGEKVWTGYAWSKLTKKWSTGVKEVNRYHLSTNTYFDSTENHRVLENYSKIEIQHAESIDRVDKHPETFNGFTCFDDFATLAGMVLGDGSMQKNGGICAYLNIGEKDADMEAAASNYVVDVLDDVKRLLKLKVGFNELHLAYAPVWEREISEKWFCASHRTVCKFLRGLYTANGSVLANGNRVSLKTTSEVLAQQVAELLETLGFRAYITINKPTLISFDNGDYVTRMSYDVSITDVLLFKNLIGFEQQYKMDTINVLKNNREGKDVRIIQVESLGQMEVFDFTVEADEHQVMVKGLAISNCGEITLTLLGGYCVIGDIVPYHCSSLFEFEEAARLTTRALIRTNLMDCVYHKEVKRTNRIGVGLTGIHEFAYSFFNYSFKDLLDEEKSMDFWQALARVSCAVSDEAESYAAQLGVKTPHTNVTIKPSGTVSKLFGLTEGAHLPSMREFVRWVQFRNDDPLVQKYKALGYPHIELVTYRGSTAIGFPTRPEICKLGMGDRLVTAPEATPEQQYQWVRLLEKYWLQGGINSTRGNQVSYTLKYDPKVVSYEQYRQMFIRYQRSIRCCSVMPATDDVDSGFEYLPEQPVSAEEFTRIVAAIKEEIAEDIGAEHIQCAGGSCPIDFEGNK